ncbi:MAG: hypothetical protein ACE5GC_03350 [Acidimicrobiia bacterium]
MNRAITLLTALALTLAACGGGDDTAPSGAAAPAGADDISIGLLAIADFAWQQEPEAGYTTPFSFEVIAPSREGAIDLSYWWSIEDGSGTAIGTTPRYDFTWESGLNYHVIPFGHALPVPSAIDGAYSMVIHVQDNLRNVQVSHVEEVTLP